MEEAGAYHHMAVTSPVVETQRPAPASPLPLEAEGHLEEASGLTWSELARHLGTNPLTLRRWRQGARPNALHLLALLQFAASLDLLHLLPLPNVQLRNGESP